jgi:tetratricopeptide (TPR) repeat protein
MNTRLLAALLMSFLMLNQLHAQKLKTPAEILKIMEDSKLAFEISHIEETVKIDPPNRTGKLNLNIFYIEKDSGSSSLKEYTLSDQGEVLSKEAEYFFQKNEYSKAREKYLELLKVHPEYYKVMTYVGQVYGIEKNWDKAIEWYKKTIELNYIDYMAHWFLADAYMETGKKELALREITIAQILNRNNPRIRNSFIDIYNKNKLNSADWVFNPQIELKKIDDIKVKVSYKKDWIGYALAKAVWEFEPDYPASMGEEKNGISVLEEKECLASLLVSTMNDKKALKKYPELNALKMAADNKMFDQYIFYEVILPDYPRVAMMISKESIESIADYVIKVRGSKKK